MARGKAKLATASEPVEGRWILPNGWRWARARDFARIVGGSTPKNASDPNNFDPSGTPWVTPADLSGYEQPTISAGRRNLAAHLVNRASILPVGSVLISSRAPVGYCAVTAAPMVTNQGFRSLVLGPDIDPFFIRYYVLYAREYLEANASGTTFKELSGSALGDLLFPLPPIEIQRAIVAYVDELFIEVGDGEAALERARGDLATWRKSLLKAAVTGELTADWRAANPPTETGADLLARILAERRTRWLAEPRNNGKRYEEPSGVDRVRLPELPPGWTWASLSQITSEQERSFQSGPFGSALLHSEFRSTGRLVIGIDNVRNGSFSFGSNHRISDEKYLELRKFKARPADVLITVMATIGRTCVVPDDIEEAIITKHVYRISLDQAVASPAFVMNTLRVSPSSVEHLFGKVQGQTRPGLNKGILELTPVPLAPINEQIEALKRVSRTSEPAEGLLDDLQRSAATTLRQSILAAAFRGDLVA